MGKPFALSQSVNTPVSGYRNAVINGNFGIWQRGNIPSTAAISAPVCDRWYYYRGTGGTVTVQREVVAPGEDFGNGLNPPYRIHINQNNQASVTPVLQQYIEDVRTFQNRTATVSGWVHSETGTINMTPYITQYFGSGGSANVDVAGTAVSCTSGTWVRFEQTFALPSISGKTIGTNHALVLGFSFPASTAYIIRMQAIQLEVGSAATPFEERPMAVELALCQRFFEKNYNQDIAPGTAGGLGHYGYIEYGIAATSGHPAFWPYKVEKRIVPGSVCYSDDGSSGYGTFSGANIPINIATCTNANRYFYTGGGAPTITAGSWQDFYWIVSAEWV